MIEIVSGNLRFTYNDKLISVYDTNEECGQGMISFDTYYEESGDGDDEIQLAEYCIYKWFNENGEHGEDQFPSCIDLIKDNSYDGGGDSRVKVIGVDIV
jgi:hypothetical protein